jgi:hypothetical protein
MIYFDDNWLCTINITPKLDWLVLFAHSSRGGKLMTTSPSHLKIQRVASRTWTQIEAHDQKWYFQEDHGIEKHDQKIIWLFFHELLFWYTKWNEPFLSNGPPPPRWSHKN